MLAVLYVLIHEGRIDRPFIEAHSQGFERLERYVLGLEGSPACTPQWAEEKCGIPAEEITRFALAYAAARPAMLLPGYSIQRVYAGEETFRLTVALQIATGNFGVRGGSTGSLNSRLPTPRVGSLSAPEIPDQPRLPIQRWPDAILQGKSGGYPTQIHAVYNLGSNLINQGSHILKSIAAFQKLDFAVTHDLFLTPTARYADVVFPESHYLERTDPIEVMPGIWPAAVFRQQVVKPLHDTKPCLEIVQGLAKRHLSLVPMDAVQVEAADRLPDRPPVVKTPDPADPIGAMLDNDVPTGSITPAPAR